MKQTLLAIVALAAALIPQSLSAHPYLLPLRAEIITQQSIAETNVPVDKKLASALRFSLAKIDKTDASNSVNAAKALASVAGSLSKSSLSNTFGPLLEASVDAFLGSLYDGADGLSNRLDAAVDSSKRTAAENKLALLLSQISGADNEANLIAAAKLVSKAVKTFVVAGKLVTKAEAVIPPTPRPGMTAEVTGAIKTGFRANINLAISPTGPNSFRVIGTGGSPASPRAVDIAFANVQPGTAAATVTGGSFTVFQGLNTKVYSGNNGSATLTWNQSGETLSGTFSFTAQNGADVITVEGSFSGSY